MLPSRVVLLSIGGVFSVVIISMVLGIAHHGGEAEKTLHAYHLVLDVLNRHLAEEKEWPKGWSDMKRTQPTGRYPFWEWPKDCEQIRKRVSVRFDLRPEELLSVNVENFDLVHQNKPHFGYERDRHLHLIGTLKETFGKETWGQGDLGSGRLGVVTGA